MTKEWTLLLTACNAALNKKTKSHLFQKTSVKDINWDTLLQIAKYHRVRPLLYKGLQKSLDLEQLPRTFTQSLKQISFLATTKNLNNTKELIRLLKLFDKSGIEVIPYKGVVLSQQAYQELGIRESSDIDLLIQQKDYYQVSKILEQEAYQERFKILPSLEKQFFQLYCETHFDLYKNGQHVFHVEPHWVLGNKMYQTYIDYPAIISLTSKTTFHGTPINLLSPEGLLITTAIHHGANDQWLYLKHIADIAALLAQFEDVLNWQLILNTCKKLQITNLVLLGLGLAKILFNSTLPNSIEKLLSDTKLNKVLPQRKVLIATGIRRHTVNQAFLSRIIFHFIIRQSWAIKLKVLYYHLVHLFFRLSLYQPKS